MMGAMPLETAMEITENVALIVVVLLLALILRIFLTQIIKRITRSLLAQDPAGPTWSGTGSVSRQRDPCCATSSTW